MIGLIVTLVVLGLILFLLESYVPMSPPMIVVIRVTIVMFAILMIMRAFGIVDIPITRVK